MYLIFTNNYFLIFWTWIFMSSSFFLSWMCSTCFLFPNSSLSNKFFNIENSWIHGSKFYHKHHGLLFSIDQLSNHRFLWLYWTLKTNIANQFDHISITHTYVHTNTWGQCMVWTWRHQNWPYFSTSKNNGS